MWKNVEFVKNFVNLQNKYGNNLIEDKKRYISAKFLHDEFGNNIIHGPENSGVRIIKSVPTIQNIQNTY